jgi:multisubunit Na+/H+ antiporter MnhC subunit
MILWALSVTATILVIAALAVQRRWLQAVTGLVIWLVVVDILIFYSGSVARGVVRQGPPAGAGADAFYVSVGALPDRLFESYLVVIYLSLLSLVNACAGHRCRPAADRPKDRAEGAGNDG